MRTLLIAAVVLAGAVQEAGAQQVPWMRAQNITDDSELVQRSVRELRQYVGGIRDQKLREAVQGRLGRGGYAWTAAAGGKTDGGHHAYPGGLAVHTLVNVRQSLASADTYEHVYGIHLNRDWLIAGAVWHDLAKSTELVWQVNGTTGKESQLGGTGAHHIWGIALAMDYGLDPQLVVTIASAHEPPNAESQARVIGFIVAAGELSKRADLKNGDPVKYGILTPILGGGYGYELARPAPIEAFVNHLADHDWVFTEEAQRVVHTLFSEEASRMAPDVSAEAFWQWCAKVNWLWNDFAAGTADVEMYHILTTEGSEPVRERIRSWLQSHGR